MILSTAAELLRQSVRQGGVIVLHAPCRAGIAAVRRWLEGSPPLRPAPEHKEPTPLGRSVPYQARGRHSQRPGTPGLPRQADPRRLAEIAVRETPGDTAGGTIPTGSLVPKNERPSAPFSGRTGRRCCPAPGRLRREPVGPDGITGRGQPGSHVRTRVEAGRPAPRSQGPSGPRSARTELAADAG